MKIKAKDLSCLNFVFTACYFNTDTQFANFGGIPNFNTDTQYANFQGNPKFNTDTQDTDFLH